MHRIYEKYNFLKLFVKSCSCRSLGAGLAESSLFISCTLLQSTVIRLPASPLDSVRICTLSQSSFNQESKILMLLRCGTALSTLLATLFGSLVECHIEIILLYPRGAIVHEWKQQRRKTESLLLTILWGVVFCIKNLFKRGVLST